MTYGVDLFKSDIRFTDSLIAGATQVPSLISQLTVEEHLEFYLRFRGCEGRQQIINQALADYDLRNCANIVASALSRNQRKKLAIAIALISDTKIVTLDEPTAGLDVVNKR